MKLGTMALAKHRTRKNSANDTWEVQLQGPLHKWATIGSVKQEPRLYLTSGGDITYPKQWVASHRGREIESFRDKQSAVHAVVDAELGVN